MSKSPKKRKARDDARAIIDAVEVDALLKGIRKPHNAEIRTEFLLEHAENPVRAHRVALMVAVDKRLRELEASAAHLDSLLYPARLTYVALQLFRDTFDSEVPAKWRLDIWDRFLSSLAEDMKPGVQLDEAK